MIIRVGCSRAVFQNQTFISSVVGFPHGCMHANIRCNSRQNQMSDAFILQDQIQVCGIKLPFPGLSMIDSPSMGASSSIICQPGSPRTKMRPAGPEEPISAPICLLRQRLFAGRSDRSGLCPSLVWMT